MTKPNFYPPSELPPIAPKRDAEDQKNSCISYKKYSVAMLIGASIAGAASTAGIFLLSHPTWSLLSIPIGAVLGLVFCHYRPRSVAGYRNEPPNVLW
jgi:hypothetical protein